MKYLKEIDSWHKQNEAHSIYNTIEIKGYDNVMSVIKDEFSHSLNVNLIRDLIDLSLDLVDKRFQLYIKIISDNFPKNVAYIRFDHGKCSFSYMERFLILPKKMYSYEFSFTKNLKLHPKYIGVSEIEDSIRGMYPDENITAV